MDVLQGFAGRVPGFIPSVAQKSNALTYDRMEARVGINRFIIFAKFCAFFGNVIGTLSVGAGMPIIVAR